VKRIVLVMAFAACATQSQALKSHRADAEMCYSMGLQRNPQLGGKIVLEVEVGDGGHAKSARIVSSTLGDNEVETCIAELAARWDFADQPPGMLTIPFDLGGERPSEP
jgi:Ca-activated chloride channel homolog